MGDTEATSEDDDMYFTSWKFNCSPQELKNHIRKVLKQNPDWTAEWSPGRVMWEPKVEPHFKASLTVFKSGSCSAATIRVTPDENGYRLGTAVKRSLQDSINGLPLKPITVLESYVVSRESLEKEDESRFWDPNGTRSDETKGKQGGERLYSTSSRDPVERLFGHIENIVTRTHDDSSTDGETKNTSVTAAAATAGTPFTISTITHALSKTVFAVWHAIVAAILVAVVLTMMALGIVSRDHHIQDLDSRIQASATEIAKLNDKIDALQSDLDSVQSQAQANEEESNRLSELSKQLEDQKAQQDQRQTELDARQSELDRKQSELDARDSAATYRQSTQPQSYSQSYPSTGGAFYKNCDAARAAGAAPLYAGQPGYRSKLDADGDGIACEWS